MTDAQLVAMTDQFVAGFEDTMDLLSGTYAKLRDKRGPEQALCDLTAMLNAGEPYNHETVAALLAVAAMRRTGAE